MMVPRSMQVSIAWLVIGAAGTSFGQGESPTEPEIARTISRGVDFLKEAQTADGLWDDPAQRSHRLGLTALAALALMENGTPPGAPEIKAARDAVRALARESEQTYDLALAILFLAHGKSQGREEADPLITTLGHRLAGGDNDGSWDYTVPLGRPETTATTGRPRREPSGKRVRRQGPAWVPGDNSNTQFALLGLWAAGRHGFNPDQGLESIDYHFRSSQLVDGRWGYRQGMGGTEAMSCAGLMALAIASARPGLAERQTARARGAALAADPAFIAALSVVSRDARRAGSNSEIYYLWSLERVCVALGLMSLDGFDWYARGARILVDRQRDDGGWPHGRWGRLPDTCLALLFLRKANLAFEIDRVLRLPRPGKGGEAIAVTTASPIQEPESGRPASEPPAAKAGKDDVTVVVTGATEQSFPRISVQFEVKRPDGSFLLDAGRDDFRVTEDGRDVAVVEFQAPRTTEAIPTTLVLVVDRSKSMEEEDRIGGLKRAVASFLKQLPEGSRVAVIAFGSQIHRLSPFTTDRGQIKRAVDRLEADGSTCFYDAVADALELLKGETGRRAILALTDGEDTSSQSATLDSVIATARRLGLPVHTLGLGSEDEIESADLRQLASSTRGQYYPVRNADQLRAIYEQIAERIRSSYTLLYQSEHPVPDGTLRPIRIFYRASQKAGEAAVFIPGMVVPAGGWSPLFLALVCGMTALVALPALISRRHRAHPG